MPVLTRQQQLEEINLHPLNQEAKRWLQLVPYPVDEDQPYLLQLMWWGLEEGHIGLTPQSMHYLRGKLLPVIYGLMDCPDKHAAWDYMTRGRVQDHHPDDPPHLSLYTLQHSMIPEEAAIRALESFEMIVSAGDGNYLDD